MAAANLPLLAWRRDDRGRFELVVGPSLVPLAVWTLALLLVAVVIAVGDTDGRVVDLLLRALPRF